MKLKIICVFLFTFYGFKVTANVDSLIVNAKNYINYKLVEYYLIKYTSQGTNKDSVQFNKDKNSFGKIKKYFRI